MSDRRTRRRHHDLASYQYDPSLDIAVDENRCWRWNSAKSEMHQYVANYFAARNEDGMVVFQPPAAQEEGAAEESTAASALSSEAA